MKHPILSAVLLCALSTPAMAGSSSGIISIVPPPPESSEIEKKNEALEEAAKVLSGYVAKCGDHLFFKSEGGIILESSQSSAELEILGEYPVLEADKLNGKEWSGRLTLDAGKSVRAILVDGEVRDWITTSSIDVDWVLDKKEWKISHLSWLAGTSYSLIPGISCDQVPTSVTGNGG